MKMQRSGCSAPFLPPWASEESDALAAGPRLDLTSRHASLLSGCTPPELPAFAGCQ